MAWAQECRRHAETQAELDRLREASERNVRKLKSFEADAKRLGLLDFRGKLTNPNPAPHAGGSGVIWADPK